MTIGLLQLVARSYQDKILIDKPEITFFKYSYKTQPLFYKEEREKKNIKLNWDSSYKFRLDKDIDLLGNLYLKMSIPFFKLSKLNVINSKTVINNEIINKLLYDSYDCYIYLIDGLYYIIPLFLMENKMVNFEFNKLYFKNIKDKLDEKIYNLFKTDSEIYLLDFPLETNINDIIHILLKFGSGIDKFYLNILTKHKNEQLNKNILTQRSLNKVTRNKLKKYLFDNFQSNYSFAGGDNIYNIISEEINFYYNIYNKVDNHLDYDNDLSKSLSFYQNNLIELDEDTFLKNTIFQNTLLIDYILKNIHSKIFNTYTFYKNIGITFLQGREFIFELTDEYIIPIDNFGYELFENIPENKLFYYFPFYRIDIKKLNFGYSSDLLLKTLDNNNVGILIDGDNNLTFRLDTYTPLETDTNIKLKVMNPLRTENSLNLFNDSNETNLNNEWNINLVKNLFSLNNANELESYLFKSIKDKYYSTENIIKNEFNKIFSSFDENEIKDLWISLQTLKVKFQSTEKNITYDNILDFFTEKSIILSEYSNYFNINLLPQDLFNSYLIGLINYFINIKDRYFTDDTFIKLFIDELFCFFYKRFLKISKLQNTDSSFFGLLFYFNLETKFYISRSIIKNLMTELFNKVSFISFVNFNNDEIQNLKTFELSYDSISNIEQNNISNNIDYFQDFKIVNNYNINEFTISENNIILDKSLFKTYFYKHSLVNFNIKLDNTKLYDVLNYTITSDKLYLEIDSIINIDPDIITINESITIPVPLYSLSETSINTIGEFNEFKKITLFNKNNKINKFNTFNQINISLPTNDFYSNYFITFINYTSKNFDKTFKVELQTNNNGIYNIITQEDIPDNFNLFENIELYFIQLPIYNYTINNSDCIENIKDTYPKIKLNKYSSFYSSELFSTLNSFKVNINNQYFDCRINSENSTFNVETNNYDNYVELLVIDNSNTFNSSSILLEIFENKYLPNLINYTYLGVNSNNLINFNNLFLQKPMILKLNSISNIPIFIFQNIPYFNDNSELYLNNKLLLFSNNSNKYKINSNQIIRDISSGSNKKYSTHYNDSNLKNYLDKDNIFNLTQEVFDNYFYSSQKYVNIINILENSYNNFYNIYTSTFSNIIDSNIFGSTISKILNEILNRNSFNTKGEFKYNIDIKNYDIIDYDIYSSLANNTFKNVNDNKKEYEFDSILLFNLKNKNESTVKMIYSPWIELNTCNRINQDIFTILNNFSSFSKYQIEYINKNIDILKLINLDIVNLDLNTQSKIISNNKKIIYNVNKFDITLDNQLTFDDKLDDYTIEFKFKNKDLNADINQNTLTGDYQNFLYEYKKTPLYIEEILNNSNHKFKKDSYNLIGFINKNDDGINLINTFSNMYSQSNYILISNIIYDKRNNNILNDSIDPNCHTLVFDTFNDISNFRKLTNTIFINKIKVNKSLPIKENIFYYSNINNINILLFYKNGFINIFSKFRINFKNKIKFIYKKANNILLNLLSDLDKYIFIPYESFFIINNLNIDSFNIFNWFITNESLENSNVTIDLDINYVLKINTTNGYILNDKLINFYNFDDSVYFIDLQINNNNFVYSENNIFKLGNVNKFLEPPLKIKNNQITLYNILDYFNFLVFDYNWIRIDNLEYQIKDRNELNDIITDPNNINFLVNGNYILYYCDSSNKPNKISYKNTFNYDFKTSSFILFDPYKSIYKLDKSLIQYEELYNKVVSSLENIKYKFNVYGTPNNTSDIGYYYPLSLNNFDNTSNTITFKEFPNTVFYYDNIIFSNFVTKEYQYLISYNLYGSNVISSDFTHSPIKPISIETDSNITDIYSLTSKNNFDETIKVTNEFLLNTNIPEIDFNVYSDSLSGFNIVFNLNNFNLVSPSNTIRQNEGFIKFYINGIEYFKFFNLLNNVVLPFGNLELKAELSLSNNKSLTKNNVRIRKIKNITITDQNQIPTINQIENISENKPSISLQVNKYDFVDILKVNLSNFQFNLSDNSYINNNEGYGKLTLNEDIFKIIGTKIELKLKSGVNKIKVELLNHNNKLVSYNNEIIYDEINIVKNGSLILNVNPEIYRETTIIMSSNNKNIVRPLVITDRESKYKMSYFDSNYLYESDSFFIINNTQDNIAFVTNLRFNNIFHSNDNIFVDSNNSNLIINNINTNNWEIKLQNLSNYEVTTDLEDIKLYKFIFDIYKIKNNVKINLEEKMIWICSTSLIENINILETTNNTSKMIIEPLYLSVDIEKILTIEDSVNVEILSVDNLYFDLLINNSESSIRSKNLIKYNNFNIKTSNTSSIGDIIGEYKSTLFNKNNKLLNTINIVNNQEKYLKNYLFNWDYINNNNIIFNKIANDTSILKDFDYFIFIKDDKLYYDEKFYYDENSKMLELKNNYNLNNVDIFAYNYLPLFIKTSFYFNISQELIYIYVENGIFEINQIIKMNDIVLRIKDYSILYRAYIGELIVPETSINNLNTFTEGFYLLGNFSNYNDKNLILKNNFIDNKLFNKQSNELVYGDYYINNNSNSLQIYNNNTTTNNVFKFKKGVYLNLLVKKESDLNKFYYDDNLINIKQGMIFYLGTNKLIVKYINFNEVIFYNQSINYNFKNGEIINVYLPLQPLELKNLIIENNEIQNKFNGYLEIIRNNSLVYLNVNNGIISTNTNIETGTYRIFEIDKVELFSNFTNYIDTKFLNFDNSKYPVLIYLKIDLLDEGISFYSSDYDFTNLKYCFNQEILIENNLFRIKNIQQNRIIIDQTIDTFTVNIDFNKEYEVIFSSGNLNDIKFSINDLQINGNYYYNYQNYDLNKRNKLNILFSSQFIENNQQFNNIYNLDIDDLEIENQNNKNIFLSKKLENLVNDKIWSEDLNKKYYINNYYPISNFDNSTFEVNENSLLIVPHLDNQFFLLEEILDDKSYIHYVKIELVNNLLKITSKNIFINIDDSYFYLNRLIPIRLTKNNYIQIIEPLIYQSREINRIENNFVEMYIYIDIGKKNSLNEVPFKYKNKWRYIVNINESEFNLLKYSDIYIKEYNNKVSLIKKGTKYYLESNFKINTVINKILVVKKVNINEIKFKEIQLKDDFLNIKDNELINLFLLINDKYKNTNIFNIDFYNLNYNLTFKHNTPPLDNLNENAKNKLKSSIVNLGILNKEVFINKNNKIKFSNIINIQKEENDYETELYNLEKENIFNQVKYVGKKYILDLEYNLNYIDNNLNMINFYESQDKSYFNKETDKSTTLSTMIDILKTNIYELSIILNNNKPWKLWSYLTLSQSNELRNNFIYEPLIYINNSIRKVSNVNLDFDNIFTCVFDKSEVDSIKNIFDLLNIDSNIDDELKKLFELQEIEKYLYDQIKLLIKFDYFWDNLTEVINKIIKNFSSENNYHSWIFYKGCIMTFDNENYEIDEILLNGNTKENVYFEKINNYYIRKTYLPHEFKIVSYNSNLSEYYGNYNNNNYFIISRDINLIISEIKNFINKKDMTYFGNNFTNIYIELLKIKNEKIKLQPVDYSIYTYIVYGTNENLKKGFYYPLSLIKKEMDIEIKLKEFPNIKFYMSKNNQNIAKTEFKLHSNLINYNEITNTNYYNYYLYGTSKSLSTLNQIGYYYPLSLISYGNDHIHTFEEFPTIKFYMQNSVGSVHFSKSPPLKSLKLISYNLELNKLFIDPIIEYDNKTVSSNTVSNNNVTSNTVSNNNVSSNTVSNNNVSSNTNTSYSSNY